MVDNFTLNRIALRTRSIISRDDGSLNSELSLPGDSLKGCSTYWLRALVHHSRGDMSSRDQNLADAMHCDDRLVILAHKFFPEDLGLAHLAIKAAPKNAEAWFWLAEVRSEEDKEQAIELFKHGLALDPKDGVRWRMLGDLLRGGDPEGSISAYLQSCYNGDPGVNGCARAGSVAEQLGLYELAIQYYRLSKYQKALHRADELEAQLEVQTQP